MILFNQILQSTILFKILNYAWTEWRAFLNNYLKIGNGFSKGNGWLINYSSFFEDGIVIFGDLSEMESVITDSISSITVGYS